MAKDKMTEKDYDKELGVTNKDIAEAWHQARDDATAAGELPERQQHKIDQAHENLVRDSYRDSGSSGRGNRDGGRESR